MRAVQRRAEGDRESLAELEVAGKILDMADLAVSNPTLSNAHAMRKYHFLISVLVVFFDRLAK